MPKDLFRSEVSEARQHQHLGTITLASSPVSWVLTGMVVIFCLALVALLVFGEYTRRVAIPGYLVPKTGVIKIYTPIAGRLKELAVREGQQVEAGARLALVADERIDAAGAEARALTARQIEVRKENLREVVQQQRSLFTQTRESTERRAAALKLEIEQLHREQRTQRTRLEYAEKNHERYQKLVAEGFVSPIAAQERVEAVVDQQGRLQALEREQTALQRDLLALQAELHALPMREQTTLADLERTIAQAEQEGIENKLRGEVVLVAPAGGRVSGLVAQPNFVVNGERPLLSLVPEHSELVAHLFAPSKDIGFVSPGQEVFMRYSAFPYQKFGHYRGVVTEVSHTPLSANELDYAIGPKTEIALLPALPIPSTVEPSFRIKIRLDRPTAQAYGREQPLQPGMQLEADILLDRRTLFEWILEPIYSLRGKYLQ